ncbi:MAG: damage-inducible protein DinB [Massilia sp.]|nr:damage-inducible protein DinB [Massilia sp.]
MNTCDHMVRMAAYNEVMNEQLYSAAAKLSAEDLFADRGAYFGSLFGTMNHIGVADTIWLKRFCAHPALQRALDPIRDAAVPVRLNQLLADDLHALLALRRGLDQTIGRWAAELTAPDLEQILSYSNTKRIVSRKRYSSLIMH